MGDSVQKKASLQNKSNSIKIGNRQFDKKFLAKAGLLSFAGLAVESGELTMEQIKEQSNKLQKQIKASAVRRHVPRAGVRAGIDGPKPQRRSSNRGDQATAKKINKKKKNLNKKKKIQIFLN